MSIQSIDILRQVFRIWNNPALSRLDSNAVVDALNRVYSQRKLDFGLSGGSFLAKVSKPFTVDDYTRTVDLTRVGVEEHFLQCRLEAASGITGRETDWHEVRLADFGDWETFRQSATFYAAVYSSSDSPQLVLNHSPLNTVYRLIYEPEGAKVGEESDGLDMPRLFQPLLVYDTAIEVGMLIDDDSPEFARKAERNIRLLAVRQNDALQRFEKWLSNRKSQSVETRQGFNERDSDTWRVNIRSLPVKLYLGGGGRGY